MILVVRERTRPHVLNQLLAGLRPSHTQFRKVVQMALDFWELIALVREALDAWRNVNEEEAMQRLERYVARQEALRDGKPWGNDGEKV